VVSKVVVADVQGLERLLSWQVGADTMTMVKRETGEAPLPKLPQPQVSLESNFYYWQ
jgi:hypothetical protein